MYELHVDPADNPEVKRCNGLNYSIQVFDDLTALEWRIIDLVRQRKEYWKLREETTWKLGMDEVKKREKVIRPSL